MKLVKTKVENPFIFFIPLPQARSSIINREDELAAVLAGPTDLIVIICRRKTALNRRLLNRLLIQINLTLPGDIVQYRQNREDT